MNRTLGGELFADILNGFWNDLSVPGVSWQILTLIICLGAGWSISRGLRTMMRNRQMHLRVMRLGVESFFRVLSPLIALAFVMIAKPVLGQYQQVRLLKLAVPLLVSYVLIRLTFYLFRRVFARSGHSTPRLIATERMVAVLVWMGYALYITGLWPDLTHFLDTTVLPLGRYKISLLTIVQAVTSVATTLVLALWGGALIEERLMRVSSMHFSLRTVASRLVRGTLILAAVLLSLSLVGIDLTILSVFGGALGVGVGLGLRKIIASYLSGFVILLERSLSIGDIVTVDKYHGQVIRINARYTVVRSLDGIENVVPNDMLISGTVQNFSMTNRRMHLNTIVTIGFASDLDTVLALLKDAVAGVPRVSQHKMPTAALIKVAAEGLELDIGFWIEDPENGRANVISDVNIAMWRMLKMHNVPIPFTQKDINILHSGRLEAVSPSPSPVVERD